jgi:protein-S-isoprenylcysteine O-methyltransferase Ste14
MRPPPPLLAIAAALAQSRLTSGEHHARGFRAPVALTVAAASGVLAGSAAGRFRRRGTTLEPMHPARASALVTDGPNAVSRNPMYVGLTGLLVANSVRIGSWRSLLPVAAFAIVIDRVQIEAEESALLSRFGADYDSYRAAVPRWLGRRSVTSWR